MKKHFKGIIIGTLVCSLLLSFTVFAASNSKMIEAYYDNIRIIIDGAEYIPTDANGKVVEPFIYNGTTYLPIRAIANAFNKEVSWDPETMTATLGTPNYNWLYKMSYIDHQQENCRSASFTLVKDGIKLYQAGHGKQTVAYKLDGEYKTFIATVYSDENNGSGATTKIYGSNKELLYAIPTMNDRSPAVNIEIDVSGHKILYLEAECTDNYESSIIFSQARLLK